MELIKRLSELIPFLQPYPVWVKVLVAAWTALSTCLLLALLFAAPSFKTTLIVPLSGQVVDGDHKPIPIATIEYVSDDARVNTVTDSEGEFVIKGAPTHQGEGRIRIAASGYHTYERNIRTPPQTTTLGIFTLQRDDARTPSVITSYSSQQIEEANVSLINAAYLSRDRVFQNPRDIYTYIDRMATDAETVAYIWQELMRDLNSNRVLDDARAAALSRKYGAQPPVNELPANNMYAEQTYFPQAVGKRFGDKWTAEFAHEVAQLLGARGGALTSLYGYLACVRGSQAEREQAPNMLQHLNMFTSELTKHASRMRALTAAAQSQNTPDAAAAVR